MNLRFIEAFVWVARLHSFTAAADKLCTTQAAISARIATLESDFGVKLFERDKRTVTLTRAGEDLVNYAEQLLGISARMFEAVSEKAAPGGFISLGVVETVVHTWLPDLLRRLRHDFPKLRVEIHSYITADLHEELLKGNIDLALAAEPLVDPAIENRTICVFEMRWIAAAAATQEAALADGERLNRLPILTFLRDSVVHRDVVAKLGPYSVTRINPISSIAVMVSLARAGYGLATLPRAAIAASLASGELIVVDNLPELAPVPIIASWRRQCEAKLTGSVVQLAVEAARAFSSEGGAGVVAVDDHCI